MLQESFAPWSLGHVLSSFYYFPKVVIWYHPFVLICVLYLLFQSHVIKYNHLTIHARRTDCFILKFLTRGDLYLTIHVYRTDCFGINLAFFA
jgi:hypothetical protein